MGGVNIRAFEIFLYCVLKLLENSSGKASFWKCKFWKWCWLRKDFFLQSALCKTLSQSKLFFENKIMWTLFIIYCVVLTCPIIRLVGNRGLSVTGENWSKLYLAKKAATNLELVRFKISSPLMKFQIFSNLKATVFQISSNTIWRKFGHFSW